MASSISSSMTFSPASLSGPLWAVRPTLSKAVSLRGLRAARTFLNKAVREGVRSKGMLAWERQLRPAELMAVSSYVGTMLGTDPPNQKEAQGNRQVRHAP